MKKVIIFGIGDLAKELYYYMKDEYNILGYAIDDDYFLEEYSNYKVKVYKKSDLKKIEDKYFLITAIGYKNMKARKKKFLELKEEGFNFINFIHKSVIFEKDLKIGTNNIIFPGTIVEPGVKIGNNNIIWSRNLLCHDSEIGSHNFIAASCLIGGFSKVLDNNFIGFNSTIIQRITLNKNILVGAKSLVNKNLNDYTKNYGIPAKEISNQEKEGMKIE